MALESAVHITDLVVNNPLSTDTVSQADDHIRLLKTVLKTTFPNLNAAVTATPAQLNSPIPRGVITMWSGAIDNIPTGWSLCNGTSGTPDLRDRFVVGAGSAYAVGNTGGSTTTSSAGGHTHTMAAAGGHNHGGVSGSTALTEAQMPPHYHTYNTATGSAYEYGTGLSGTSGLDSVTGSTTGTTGSGAGHNHTISSEPDHSHTVNSVGGHEHSVTPPYYALAYIMKS